MHYMRTQASFVEGAECAAGPGEFLVRVCDVAVTWERWRAATLDSTHEYDRIVTPGE